MTSTGTANEFLKTRIAPTPSGYLHLGNAFSFALTVAIAYRMGAPVLLRIDDLDLPRVRREYVEDIFSTLRFLDLTWQEGPADPAELTGVYSQQLRMPQYVVALEQLQRSGDLFACTCSRSAREAGNGYPGTCRNKKIPLQTAGACWRLRTDPAEDIVLKIHGRTRPPGRLPAHMSDFVVRKKDGFPAYQLTSVVDDEYFSIGSIVRGEDLMASTLAQALIAKRLGAEKYLEAGFFFHPLLKDRTGRKLSKSEGDLSVSSMIRNGITPEQLYRVMGQALGLTRDIRSWEPLADFFTDLPA